MGSGVPQNKPPPTAPSTAQQQTMQRQRQQPSPMLPNSVLFSGSFYPPANMLTLDAKWDNNMIFNSDVSTAQHVFALARQQEHSRSAGRDALYKMKHNMTDGATKQQLDAVLTEIQQELSEQGAINSRLQAGVSDSLEALGAYMRGLPTAHREHQLAETNLQERPKMAVLQQPPGVEMAGGFSVPPADERPGGMDASEYLSTLGPKLLRLQQLRQQPFAPRHGDVYMPWALSQTAGLQKLQQLVTCWPCEPHQRLELETVLNQLHWEYRCKHDLCRGLWTTVASLGMWLQYYAASTLVLRWHTRWLAAEQVEQPADWLYSALRAAASPTACVNYQMWLHEAHSTSTASSMQPAASHSVQASFCLASGQGACQFMWRDAPKNHGDQVPAGMTCFVFGADTRHSQPLPGSSSVTSAGRALNTTVVSSPMRPKPQAHTAATCGSPAAAAAAAATGAGTQAPADVKPRPEKKNKRKPKRAPVKAVEGSNPDSSSSKPAPDIAKTPAAAPVPAAAPAKQHHPVQPGTGAGSPTRASGRRTVGSTTAVPAPVSSSVRAALLMAAPGSPAAATVAKCLGAGALSAAAGSTTQLEFSRAAGPASTPQLAAAAASTVSSYAAAAAAGKLRATLAAPKASKAPRRVSTQGSTPATRSSSGALSTVDSWGAAGNTWASTDTYVAPTGNASSPGSWSIGANMGNSKGGQRFEGSRSRGPAGVQQWQRKSAAVVPAVQATVSQGWLSTATGSGGTCDSF